MRGKFVSPAFFATRVPGYVIGQDADNSDVPLVESIKSLAKLLGGGGPRIMKK